MIDYRAGAWGFLVACGWRGSLAPRALAMAIPNAGITFAVATFLKHNARFAAEFDENGVAMSIGAFTTVMIFILHNRSRTSYNRWWEGGTLLQKTRGEWFNAYSSIMAFTSTKPELQEQVEAYTHLLARLMSLLMCCGLQQVSPNRDRPFSILDLEGVEPESMEFLNQAPDKVEIILQWIQRSMVLHMQTGVLPVAPPILSRAFQEVSRGIVNLQNARKIADFPYPYPLAQVCIILQMLHWVMTPFAAPLAAPREWAVVFSFLSIFVLWCLHFNALDLEFPFGDRVNDLPMHEFQQDWNNSICSLLDKRATRPPMFKYDPRNHHEIRVAMSDASALYVPQSSVIPRGCAVIKVAPIDRRTMRESCTSSVSSAPKLSPFGSIHRTVRLSESSTPVAGSVDSSASFQRGVSGDDSIVSGGKLFLETPTPSGPSGSQNTEKMDAANSAVLVDDLVMPRGAPDPPTSVPLFEAPLLDTSGARERDNLSPLLEGSRECGDFVGDGFAKTDVAISSGLTEAPENQGGPTSPKIPEGTLPSSSLRTQPDKLGKAVHPAPPKEFSVSI